MTTLHQIFDLLDLNKEIIICEDFNVRFNCNDDDEANELVDFFNSYNSLNFQTVFCVAVRDAINPLKNTKSRDPYDMNVDVIKSVMNIIIYIYIYITFN